LKTQWHIVPAKFERLAMLEIARNNDRTELSFTHVGLIRAIECYGICSDAWGFYINHSLFTLITKGKGEPSRKVKAAAQSVEQ
jgi:hypothetical protein